VYDSYDLIIIKLHFRPFYAHRISYKLQGVAVPVRLQPLDVVRLKKTCLLIFQPVDSFDISAMAKKKTITESETRKHRVSRQRLMNVFV
jgi:hypothetical protein